jgi:hypothetical protein
MTIKDKFLRNSRFNIELLGFSYEITPEELLNRQSVDERIQKLEKVRQDLLDAVDAVKSLEDEAHKNKKELEELNVQLNKLREDKQTTEQLLELPQQSFARVLDKASKGAQWRGLIIGLVLGILASLIASWIWSRIDVNPPSAQGTGSQTQPKG